MNKICRICLEEGVLSSVFTKNFNLLSYCDMVEYCCNVKISRNDGLPEQMCSNCVYKLGVAYHFKQTCESADVRLRQYLGIRGPEKVTDVSVMTDPILPPPQTFVKKCKCKPIPKKSSTNYKKKPESEKVKPGPKPKPRPVLACLECHKQFRCQAQLDMHVRTHTGDKPFPCMYCPRCFTQRHNLTIHLRIHTGEKPFQCDVCSKRFSAQGNLHAHLKIHTGQRDHVCSLCNKSFITSSELTRHMSKHRGVRDFKCDLCGAAYIHARDLKLHRLNKHQVQPQSSKAQNENFNNSSNIDIIGIDVGKDLPVPPVPTKGGHGHHIMHLVNEKPVEQKTEEHPLYKQKMGTNHPLYNQKEEKEIYHHHQYANPKEKPGELKKLEINQPLPLYEHKEVKEMYHPCSISNGEKSEETIRKPDVTHPLYDHKMKEFYHHQYITKESEGQSCTICGQGFDYVTALAQHYMHQHKGMNLYEAT